MGIRSGQPGPRRLRWLAGLAALVAVLAAIGAGAWYCFGRTVWVEVAGPVRGADDVISHRTIWTVPRYVVPASAPAAGRENARRDATPAVTPDGKTRYSAQAVPGRGADIFVSRLAGGAWGPPEPLAAVNSDYDDLAPSVSPAGDWLYFASDRPGGQGGLDLYRCRLWPDGRCDQPANLGPQVNTPANETDPRVTASAAGEAADAGEAGGFGGQRMTFATDRVGGAGTYDLMSSQLHELYAVPVRLAPPKLSAGHWVGIAVLVVVVPLGLLLRLAGYRPLDLQAKCVVASIVVHGAVMVLLAGFFVYKPLFHFVAKHEAISTDVTLTNWQDDDRPAAVPVAGPAEATASAAPAADAAAVALPRQPVGPIAAAPMQATELAAPPAAVAMPPVAAQPLPPRQAAPPAVPDLPRPPPGPAMAEAPAIRVPVPAPVEVAEARPQAPAEPPAPAAASPANLQPPVLPAAAPPVELALPAAPARVAGESIAQAPAILPPAVPDAPRAAMPAPALPAVLAPQAPQVDAPGVPVAAAPDAAPAGAPEPVLAAYGFGGPALDAVRMPTSAPAGGLSPGQGAGPEGGNLPVPAARSTAGAGNSLPGPVAIAVARSVPAAGAAGESLVPRVSPGLAAAAAPGAPQINLSALAPLAAGAGAVARIPAGAPLPEAFAQRSPDVRLELLDARGGSVESEAAVQKALVYLASIQADDGHWPFEVGQVASSRPKTDPAITGLVSLCFLAGGHAPGQAGTYGPWVKRGIDFLVRAQRENGDLRAVGGDMYSHAIATLAVAEAAGMTDDPVYRVAAIKAARFIVTSQHRTTGGWRYNPGDPGDTSVFGWQIMALRSVESVGVKIPAETRELAGRWLTSASRSPRGMLVGYQGPTPTTPRMTAEALASRLFLGQQLTDEQTKEACDYLQFTRKTEAGSAAKATETDYYYWYYGSLALDQLQNEAWRKWNQQVQPALRQLQKPDGSWEADRTYYGIRGGKTYATALATLTLEVYYRYLPMSRKKAENPKP